jgi:catechol 2,3-dioxygenase-like lactoylglutathione lyase family enzyme
LARKSATLDEVPVIQSIDHIVILVRSLEEAIADYEALGFTVTPGGAHADGATHNALVPFQDGSYLELIAFTREAPGHRWWKHQAAGGGLVDFALLPSDPAGDIVAARERGLDIAGPTDGGRTRLDGQEVRWLLGAPADPALPFLCGDVTPRALRVPEGDARRHANGVVGVDGITVAVADAEAAAKHYAALLGVDVPPVAHIAPIGLDIAVFELDPDAIALAQPVSPRNPLQERLNARGPGIYSIALLTDQAPAYKSLDPKLTHGALIELHQS